MFRFFLLVLLFSIILVEYLPDALALDALERTPIESPRLVNAFGNPVFEHVNVNQQVQISADITNMQAVTQPFVYIVQIRDETDTIISLSWISGSLISGQSFSPALSWIPTNTGTFTAKILVWENMKDADALSEPAEIKITSS